MKNDLRKIRRIEEAVDFPNVILFDNTSACNLRCAMCDHRNISKYRKIQKMDIGLYRRLIDEIAAENPRARIWEIFFGEPFLLDDMPERIRYAKDKGLVDVVTNTNGVLMTPDKSRRFIEAGLDAIYVGIDAATPETYAKIRVGGDFRRVVANVMSYRDLLASAGTAEQKLFVQFVVSSENEAEADAFKEFWAGYGVNVKIRPKISWAGLIPAHNLRHDGTLSRLPCYWLMQTMNICADGRIALCSVDLHCRVPCGDANGMSIKEIWRNSELRRYRKMHASGDFESLPEMCRGCGDWQSTYADYVMK